MTPGFKPPPGPRCAGSKRGEAVNRAYYEADTQNTACLFSCWGLRWAVGPKQPARHSHRGAQMVGSGSGAHGNILRTRSLKYRRAQIRALGVGFLPGRMLTPDAALPSRSRNGRRKPPISPNTYFTNISCPFFITNWWWSAVPVFPVPGKEPAWLFWPTNCGSDHHVLRKLEERGPLHGDADWGRIDLHSINFYVWKCADPRAVEGPLTGSTEAQASL